MVSWLCCCACECATFPASTDWEDCLPDDADYDVSPRSLGGTPVFYTSGGYLCCDDGESPSINDDALLTRDYTEPTGSGYIIEVGVSEDVIYHSGTGNPLTSTVGIFIQNGSGSELLFYYIAPSSGSPDDAILRIAYNGGSSSVVLTGQSDANDLKVVLTETAADTYDVGLYLNGTLQQTDTGQSITITTSFKVGFICTDRGCWKCHYVKLTDGT